MAIKFEFGETILDVGEDVMAMKVKEPQRSRAINYARELVKELHQRNTWSLCMFSLVETAVWELKPQPCFFYPFRIIGRSFVVRYAHDREMWVMNVHQLPAGAGQKMLPWHAAWENPAPRAPLTELPALPKLKRRRKGSAERYAHAALQAAMGGILYVLHRISETPSFEHIVSAIGARLRAMRRTGETLLTHVEALCGAARRRLWANLHTRVTQFSEGAVGIKVRPLEQRLVELWPGFSLALRVWADDEPNWNEYLFGRKEDEHVAA